MRVPVQPPPFPSCRPAAREGGQALAQAVAQQPGGRFRGSTPQHLAAALRKARHCAGCESEAWWWGCQTFGDGPDSFQEPWTPKRCTIQQCRHRVSRAGQPPGVALNRGFNSSASARGRSQPGTKCRALCIARGWWQMCCADSKRPAIQRGRWARCAATSAGAAAPSK